MRFPTFVPREEKFFFLLHQSAENLQKASIKLQNLFNNYENVSAKVKEIKDLEEFGDQIIHDIFQALHRTFVTPIDREDISALAQRLDDFIDAIEEVSNYLIEYRIQRPTEYAQHLATILVHSADQLEKATALLHYRGSKLKQILPHTVEINRLENEADQVIGRAMGDLFDNNTDAIYIMKWRDIYNDLESATDRAEDAANVLEAIVLKNA
ncbi:MAG: DUF47 domain-containing protein [Dehalococcoidia bacterium]|nr:DUF47 domain-containing protein [Dehalococcoidia bacterium]